MKTADPKLNLFNSHKRYVRNQGEGDNIIFLPLEVLIVWDYNLRLSSQGPRKKSITRVVFKQATTNYIIILKFHITHAPTS